MCEGLIVTALDINPSFAMIEGESVITMRLGVAVDGQPEWHGSHFVLPPFVGGKLVDMVVKSVAAMPPAAVAEFMRGMHGLECRGSHGR